jgi:hypothetical protein
LAFSIYDSTEEAIQKMIEASQRMINEQHNSSVVRRDFKLKIKTLLQNAPRDPEKARTAFAIKRKREGRGYAHIKDIERLVIKIEMLSVVFVFGVQK